MFKKPVTIATATKIATTVNALMSAGDPATAESLRRWFNATFRDFVIEQVTDEKRIMGYKLTSSVYGLDLRETEVKAPVARKRVAPVEQTEEQYPAPSGARYAGWYEKLDAILPPVLGPMATASDEG